ncbi:MAG TPA: hypothetical protein VF169_14780 [Albitalea sp.]
MALVERRSRYVLLIKTNGKDAVSVVNALTEHVQRPSRYIDGGVAMTC